MALEANKIAALTTVLATMGAQTGQDLIEIIKQNAIQGELTQPAVEATAENDAATAAIQGAIHRRTTPHLTRTTNK